MSARARSTWCRASDHVGCSAVKAVGCECACHGPVEAPRHGPKPGTVDREKASAAATWQWARRRAQPVTIRPTTTKEDAPCCVARRDKLGRLPIGFCSKRCVRRPQVQR